MIALAARRNPTWELNISVSRQVVFYSTTLVAVGLYFLSVIVGDELIVSYGGSWGGVVRIVFLVGASVVLAGLLVSNTLRARAKVFLSKHFFHNKYDYREEWLRLVATLSKFDDKSTRQVVIEAMAQMVASPSGLLWVLDEQGKTYQLTASYKSDEPVPDKGVDDEVVTFMNRLTAFLMHDLNNLIAQQSLIVSNAEKHRRNPEFVDDAIQTIANSVDRMNRVMALLKRGDADSKAKPAGVHSAVSAAVDRCAGRAPVPVLCMDTDDVQLSINTEEIAMVLAHLIRNAQDATPPDGSIAVSVVSNTENVLIAIEDTGAGMSPQFVRERLFRPFDSTKGVQGMGIGAYQAREFARKFAGDLRVESEPGKGTTITVVPPYT